MLSPIIRKSLLAAASCTLLASCLLGTQSKRGSVVDNELRVGTIYAANGDPAANARVRVYPVGHLPDTVADTAGSAGNQDVYATRTDGKGQYKIGELPQGEYNILADQAGQYAIQDSVYLDEKTATLASDTLDEPGSLVGVVGMQPNHDPRFALVQVLGTYNYANVDAFGRFTLAALAEGKYTLRVFTSLTDYNTLFKSITILAGKQDTLRDTLVLPYLGIPVVTGLKATFDTLHSIVSLSWDSAAYRDFSQYQVYRDAQPVLDATKIPVGTTTDTTFHDNLVGILGGGGSAPITTPATYEYRIRIKSKSDQIGLSYGNAAIRTPPPTLVQTDIALQVKSIKWDSIIQADSIEVSATLRNPTRKLVSLVWTVGAGADSVRNSLAMDSLGATLFAERTLKFGWKAEGALLVGVTVTDDAGTAWTKNLTLQGNTAPSMTGTPDSTAKAYETYIFTPLVSDPDHDALRFSIANAPAWATFDSLTGVLSGTPTNADSGTDSGIVISVTDGRRRAESDAFQVRIVATPWIPGAKSPRNINTVLVSAVAAGGKIFLLGDNLLAYDPVSAIWTTEAQIPFLPTFTAAIGEKIFCINVWGPADDRFGPLQENYMYDVVSRVWEKKSPIPRALLGMNAGAVVDGVLYLMSKTNVWAYNASLDSWIQKGSMPDKIYGDKISSASCVAADGKILVMGAVEDGPSQTLLNLAGLVHVYDPVTDSWTEATPATPRAYVGIEAVGKNVYVAGGIDNLSYRPTNRMQVFDIRTGIWKEKAPMPNAVYNMAFVEAGGRIFFFKGTDGTRNVEETWIYDPAVDP